ncbi:MAG TPA: hypothetical protein VIU63_06710, partial [Nitrospira sp.]
MTKMLSRYLGRCRNIGVRITYDFYLESGTTCPAAVLCGAGDTELLHLRLQSSPFHTELGSGTGRST